MYVQWIHTKDNLGATIVEQKTFYSISLKYYNSLIPSVKQFPYNIFLNRIMNIMVNNYIHSKELVLEFINQLVIAKGLPSNYEYLVYNVLFILYMITSAINLMFNSCSYSTNNLLLISEVLILMAYHILNTSNLVVEHLYFLYLVMCHAESVLFHEQWVLLNLCK